ncbi:MAG: PIN domain-containing protein [Thalassobaculum sp.]|uniref:PIN domain-containing protein n=1 Tax=Thalassobaculum sp. TaxID=2022740 RepID=UPI0032EED112
MAGAFLDTNVLVYAFTDDPRAARAEELLARGGTISVQVLTEFANVAHRKLGLTWHEVAEASEAVRRLCQPVLDVDLEDHVNALRLASRHRFRIFDAQVLASALRGRCSVLLTEDLQDGLVIDGRLTVANPFRAA